MCVHIYRERRRGRGEGGGKRGGRGERGEGRVKVQVTKYHCKHEVRKIQLAMFHVASEILESTFQKILLFPGQAIQLCYVQ